MIVLHKDQEMIVVLYERKFYRVCLHALPMLQLFSKKSKTKKPRTTPKERAQILLSLQNGHTTRQIVKSTNISPSTVSCINKRWHEQHSLKDAAKPGRPYT